MYLIPIHVPIYLDGNRTLVTSDWKRSLNLLRDSFGGQFGPIHVLAPFLPVDIASHDNTFEEIVEPVDGIKLIPSFDMRCRARRYWISEHRRWRASLMDEIPKATVIHAGLDDIYRPIMYSGFLEALRWRKPTVFVQDMDVIQQLRELSAARGAGAMIKASIYGAIYERLCRHGVKHANLTLLKGMDLMSRYGGYARNARLFHDTSYSARDVIPEDVLQTRLRSLVSGTRPVRMVYCGRLVARKGVDRSIALIRDVRALGGNVELDVIGGGPERSRLDTLIEAAGLGSAIRFLGPIPYGSSLLQQLRSYDGLLFTPTAEDTPRMIFDGYAAGLPLIANDIAYVRERANEDRGAILLPRHNNPLSLDIFLGLVKQPEQLVGASMEARRAGVRNAAEEWYRRRFAWTLEAVDQHEVESKRT
jgi:glycosyltransferase involved in cell wall biosynthesis